MKKEERGIFEEKEKERQKMVQKKESLQRSADSIKEEEMNAIEKLDTADELVKDAEKKLKTALARSSMSKSSIDAANMMLQKGNETRDQAEEELEKIREKIKSLDERKNKLLDQAFKGSGWNLSEMKSRRRGKTS